eukprot:g50206.t1
MSGKRERDEDERRRSILPTATQYKSSNQREKQTEDMNINTEHKRQAPPLIVVIFFSSEDRRKSPNKTGPTRLQLISYRSDIWRPDSIQENLSKEKQKLFYKASKARRELGVKIKRSGPTEGSHSRVERKRDTSQKMRKRHRTWLSNVLDEAERRTCKRKQRSIKRDHKCCIATRYSLSDNLSGCHGSGGPGECIDNYAYSGQNRN